MRRRGSFEHNGRTRHGKQNYKCRDCGRQFVLDPVWKAITPEQYGLSERMLLERVSLAGIARVLQISEDTVQRYVNAKWVGSGRCDKNGNFQVAMNNAFG